MFHLSDLCCISSQTVLHVPLISSSVGMAVVLACGRFAMRSMIVVTGLMNTHTMTAVSVRMVTSASGHQYDDYIIV